ncbi:decarboxylating NADP(+)-dependent phosphogluconate dehydrogenase [Spirochaeta thermophila]|uniref:6-phosphogluconate dehydrogenase, decarboxylating n=1 Tax=Winmispira thermophila (strain ATCC 49972 / DSM 6192 / RI 19.B1) TaxID=665571 RepID=E0RPS3_WINT6|nr:decarboxylating NADP(+)-dependent phosphogluconate dehydrogenase [Spirochaeta thermophila]ADN01387.1 6-phosphogluconate dehydrogenase, decarboxylating [Spirochaeta thermophila DSM 6192]
MTKADIGLIGLAVMGQNLALNINDKGYRIAVFNRTVEKVDDFLAGPAGGRETVYGAHTLEEFVSLLSRPRKIILMVKAGAVVDEFIRKLLPLLEPGDLIIDGGNSHFSDSTRRTRELAEKGILFIGTGISGGEEGARHGPSMMPGGNPEAWPLVKEIFQAISAKTPDGQPCCDWVGPEGAGHFVKMVHNGIEYGDMQLIAEVYHIMKSLLGLSHERMSGIFDRWNRGKLGSYLIEITRDILAFKDEDGGPLVEKILDAAGQKGTGKWTGIEALDHGVPVTLIVEAVFARSLSSFKDERVHAAEVLGEPLVPWKGTEEERARLVDDLEKALLAAKMVSYAQGFMLMREASHTYGWDLDFGKIATLWRAGCIIRSVFLDTIREAYRNEPGLSNLLLAPYFKETILEAEASWRRVVSTAVTHGIPTPALSSALSFLDGYRTSRLPANLIQAQRDYFGAHTYERVDRPRGQFFHTNWTGRGGATTSGTYTV